MINTLALNLVATVMNWDNETATEEYGWLQLMSSMKYDGYSDFRAGVRFLENLVSWLRHFDTADRPAAYEFVKTRRCTSRPSRCIGSSRHLSPSW